METVRRLKCPKCQKIFLHPGGGPPTCQHCGFGGSARATATAATARTTTTGTVPMMASATPTTVIPLDPVPVTLARQPTPGQLGRVGKSRGYLASLFLGVITFGIYFLVYQYKVYAEVNEHRGTRHAAAAFWFGILLNPIFWTVYHAQELRNLNMARRDVGLSEDISVTGFFAWMTWGILLVGLGPFIAFYQVNRSLRSYWARVA